MRCSAEEVTGAGPPITTAILTSPVGYHAVLSRAWQRWYGSDRMPCCRSTVKGRGFNAHHCAGGDSAGGKKGRGANLAIHARHLEPKRETVADNSDKESWER